MGCNDSEETAVHVLCESVAYSAYRFEHFGPHFLEPLEFGKQRTSLFVSC